MTFSLAYRSGVTSSITPPTHAGFLSGVGALFSLDSAHKFDNGAVIKEGGVHVSVGHQKTSIGTQIAALRRLLLRAVEDPGSGEASAWFQMVVNVSISSSGFCLWSFMHWYPGFNTACR